MTAYNIVSPGALAAGQPEDISVVLANFQAIATIINGGLDDTNIAPGAGIQASKLSGLPGGGPVSFVAVTGTIDGSNKIFTIPTAPSPTSSLMLLKDGLFMEQGASADYTISGATITMTTAPAVGCKLLAGIPTATISGNMGTDTIWDAKGDSLWGTADNVGTRLAVGPNGQVPIADSSQAAGVRWGILASGATVATTIAGLGTASDGKLGLLRMGSTPYEHLAVIYDATYGKWVSPSEKVIGGRASNVSASAGQVMWGYIQDLVGFGTGGGVVQWSYPQQAYSLKRYTDAGLTPQFRLMGRVKASSTSSKFQLGIAHGNYGDTTEPTNNTATDLITSPPSTPTIRDSGWVTATLPATPKDYMLIGLFLNEADGGGFIEIDAPRFEIRWVG